MPINGASRTFALSARLIMALSISTKTLHCPFAIGIIICVAPQLGLKHSALGEIPGFSGIQLDNADANICPAYIDGENSIVTREHPRRRQLEASDQARLVWIVPNRNEFNLVLHSL